MPAKKIDRRVDRSRDAILMAMRSLLLERGYERLTIQNILDRANVGRATFYAHFQSKDDLLAASIQRMRAGLIAQASSATPGADTTPRLPFTLHYFRHVASHQRIYENCIVRESGGTVERQSRAMVKELVREELISDPAIRQKPAAAIEVAVQYVAGALFSVMLWWLEHQQPLSPEEVNLLFQRLTFPGLEVALGALPPTTALAMPSLFRGSQAH